jgi:TRAP-type C4-dicarboxylate transport system permease large subunit
VATGVAGVKFEELVKSIAPFVVAELAVLVLLIFFPQIILFIPNLVLP